MPAKQKSPRPWVLVYGHYRDGLMPDGTSEIRVELFKNKWSCMAKLQYVQRKLPWCLVLGYGETVDGEESLRLLALAERGIKKEDDLEKGQGPAG